MKSKSDSQNSHTVNEVTQLMFFAMLNPTLPLLKKFYFPTGLGGCEKAGRGGSAQIYIS